MSTLTLSYKKNGQPTKKQSNADAQAIVDAYYLELEADPSVTIDSYVKLAEAAQIETVASSTDAPSQDKPAVERGEIQSGNGTPDVNGLSKLADETEALVESALDDLVQSAKAEGRASNKVLFACLHHASGDKKSAVRLLKLNADHTWPTVSSAIQTNIMDKVLHLTDDKGVTLDKFKKRAEELGRNADYFTKQVSNILTSNARLLGRILFENESFTNYDCRLSQDGELEIPWRNCMTRDAVLQQELARADSSARNHKSAVTKLTETWFVFGRKLDLDALTMPARVANENATSWAQALYKENGGKTQGRQGSGAKSGPRANVEIPKDFPKPAIARQAVATQLRQLTTGSLASESWSNKVDSVSVYFEAGRALGIYSLDDKGQFLFNEQVHADLLAKFNKEIIDSLARDAEEKAQDKESAQANEAIRNEELKALAFDIKEKNGERVSWANRYARIMGLDDAKANFEAFMQHGFLALCKVSAVEPDEIEETTLDEVSDLLNVA